MSMQDPVSDMLTRIRNGQMASLANVAVPHSKLKAAIAKLLLDQGYIRNYSVVDNGNNKSDISVDLKYYRGKPVIEAISRVSRPGLRRYFKYTELPAVKGGLGCAVVSTSQGLMTDREARESKLGGELLFTVE